jgi:ankyrin repeat protein
VGILDLLEYWAGTRLYLVQQDSPFCFQIESIMTDKRKIFHVIRRGEFAEYKTTINKYDINIVDENGYSLLHAALSYRQYKIALDLINREIDINWQDKNGMTCLHYLGFFRNLEVAQAILDKGGDLEIKDKYGNTPLWYAAFNARGNYDLVNLYIKHNANPNSINDAGKSPLMFAGQINDQKMIQLLTSSGD